MIEYKLIKEIEKNPRHTQRSLAQKLNISLGKVNYIISGLIEKGIIRAKKLKNDPDKIRWQYILTPRGMKEKLRITHLYLKRRIQEFEQIQNEIIELKKEVVISSSGKGMKDTKQKRVDKKKPKSFHKG
jgi:EPS-associated MarR family transcriptional regulator